MAYTCASSLNSMWHDQTHLFVSSPSLQWLLKEHPYSVCSYGTCNHIEDRRRSQNINYSTKRSIGPWREKSYAQYMFTSPWFISNPASITLSPPPTRTLYLHCGLLLLSNHPSLWHFVSLYIFLHQQLVLSSIITSYPSLFFQMTNIWIKYKPNFQWCIFITPLDFTEVFNQKAVTRTTANSVNLCRNVDETGQGSRRCLFVGCWCEGVGFCKELRRWWRLDSQHQMLSNPGWVIATTLTQRLTRFLLTSLAGKCSTLVFRLSGTFRNGLQNIPWYYCFMLGQYIT